MGGIRRVRVQATPLRQRSGPSRHERHHQSMLALAGEDDVCRSLEMGSGRGEFDEGEAKKEN